ncbi:cysteine synthase A [Nitratifractor salsuginis]|uniref:Cysteine synthase n=1 Tax=Nitratifractor salsuginis (strain DSM 16511 / JCM 12458 / E9I37-1) TaxID=749222 RepID=E6WYQ5_NITSE|nr:cysteine synthase A [Nitratifractor salsuginis]ADV45426.1 cysteine synthase [Nitratifractor salsuginis DSM 16511]
MIFDDIQQTIGQTPLIRLAYLSNNATILAKAEYFNPGSSIKDRVAKSMIDGAMERGELDAETVVIEPTSGNTGIGLALVCAVRGLRLILTMPESMSLERRKLLRHLGAELVLTPAAEGMQGAIEEARRLAASFEKSFIPDQFANPDNPAAHERGTAQEILEATGGAVNIFVAAVGTGGTLSGNGRALKAANPKLRLVAVEPAASPAISRGEAGPHKIQGIGAGFVPDNLDLDLVDEVLTVTDEEAIAFAREAARKAGLLVGISSGANLAAAYRLAQREENRGKTIVTVLPDTAERYLSTELFE